MSKYKRIIQNLQDQIDDLDYQYWESSPSDPQKQIDLLYKMINRLNTMLYQLAVKEEEQSNHQGENR
jgi:NAD-dependent DNA ligase